MFIHIYFVLYTLISVINITILKLFSSILVYLRAMLFSNHSVNRRSVRFGVLAISCPEMDNRCIFYQLRYFVYVLWIRRIEFLRWINRELLTFSVMLLITEFLQDFKYNSCDIISRVVVRIDTFNNFYTGVDKFFAKIRTRVDAEHTHIRIPIILHTRESGQLIQRCQHYAVQIQYHAAELPQCQHPDVIVKVFIQPVAIL